jgi:hypothetical protein
MFRECIAINWLFFRELGDPFVGELGPDVAAIEPH